MLFAVTTIIPLLIAIAFVTLLERKILAVMQMRRGPNVVGLIGVLQPIMDGLKLFIKEGVVPFRANKVLFLLAPILMFSLSILNWLTIPWAAGYTFVNLNETVLYFLALSSLSVYGLILAGWSSNSNYALLGSLRAAAQMVSYEICLAFTIFPVLMFSNSLNLEDIVNAQKFSYIYLFLPAGLMFFIRILAETGRTPFDLPEAEGELVAGYNVEYSALQFALFFLAEYGNILLVTILSTVLFLGGLNVTILGSLKAIALVTIFIWIRATLPRYRFDQLMQLGWQYLLPLSLAFILLVFVI